MWREHLKRLLTPIIVTGDRYKIVVCVNCAINMSAGKMAAQVAHGAEKSVMVMNNNTLVGWRQRQYDRFMWLKSGHAKIVVAARDEAHLANIHADAREMGVPTCLVRDAGRTEILAGTVTVLTLGPYNETEINAVSGHLRPIKEWPHPTKKWKEKKLKRQIESRSEWEKKMAGAETRQSAKMKP